MAVRLEAMSGEAVAQKDKIVAKTWLDAMQALLPQFKKKFTEPTLKKSPFSCIFGTGSAIQKSRIPRGGRRVRQQEGC